MKRDINYIKHIRPQIKDKERTDKATSSTARQERHDRECRMMGIEPPSVDIVEAIGLFNTIRSWIAEKKRGMGK